MIEILLMKYFQGNFHLPELIWDCTVEFLLRTAPLGDRNIRSADIADLSCSLVGKSSASNGNHVEL